RIRFSLPANSMANGTNPLGLLDELRDLGECASCSSSSPLRRARLRVRKQQPALLMAPLPCRRRQPAAASEVYARYRRDRRPAGR
ncbi:hypothetical protein AB9F45_37475, partial [Rhizobium leguminosarum]|uniref:hypothetical protein n=1 Tax=Rhizobium leguminosarum TaxID=384 RepID=UPI003F9A5BDE